VRRRHWALIGGATLLINAGVVVGLAAAFRSAGPEWAVAVQTWNGMVLTVATVVAAIVAFHALRSQRNPNLAVAVQAIDNAVRRMQATIRTREADIEALRRHFPMELQTDSTSEIERLTDSLARLSGGIRSTAGDVPPAIEACANSVIADVDAIIDLHRRFLTCVSGYRKRAGEDKAIVLGDVEQEWMLHCRDASPRLSLRPSWVELVEGRHLDTLNSVRLLSGMLADHLRDGSKDTT
jgi:hypothetical protein